VDRLDPRAKLAIIACFSLIVFFLEDWTTVLSAFTLAILLWPLAGLRLAGLLPHAKPLRFLFVFLILAQAFFHPGKTSLWGSPLTLEGLLFGFTLCLRVLTLAFTLPLLLATSSVEEIVLALTRLGLPYRTAYTATTALNQLPVLRADMESITAAQRLRGSSAFIRGGFFRRLRAYPSLAVPLVMTSMRRAKLMGVAMDARAFGSSSKRTSIQTLRFTFVDGLASLAALIVSCALVAIDRTF
jgi:energy-coupling factor transport system permease protein